MSISVIISPRAQKYGALLPQIQRTGFIILSFGMHFGPSISGCLHHALNYL